MGDGKEVRSAVWGSKWLILQARQQLAVQVRRVPTVYTFLEHSRGGGERGARSSANWREEGQPRGQPLAAVSVGEYGGAPCTGSDAEWGSGEGSARTQDPGADRG